MLLLLTLIGRAVAIEFRSKHASPRWRQSWDVVFSAASFGAALLMGVAFGNVISGVPIDGDRNVTASLLDLLHPYAILVALTTIFAFCPARRHLSGTQDRRADAGACPLVDPPAGDRFLTRLCHRDDGDVAVSAAHGGSIQARPELFVFRGRAAGRREYSARDISRAGVPRVPLVLVCDCLPDGAGGARALSDAAALDAGCRAQPDDLQRRVIGEDARHHARHRHHRRAGRAHLHDGDVLWIFRGKVRLGSHSY